MKTGIRLKLKIKDVELELSKDEIIELKDMLNELFPKRDILKEYIPYIPSRPYEGRWWEYNRPTQPIYTPTITWCGGTVKQPSSQYT